MKQLATIIFACISSIFLAYAQTPTAFKYQAVLRDASGQVMANEAVNIKVSILQGSITGTEVFSEAHNTLTNTFGLVNIDIGSVNINGLASVDWANGSYFVQVAVNGSVMGISQLLSVPYALHAGTADNDLVDDADADPTNELQDISVNGNKLSISKGSTINLPANNDNDPSNEIQDLSLSGTNLSITNGSTVDLSVIRDGTGTDNQRLFLNNNRLLSISNGNTVDLPYLLAEKDGDNTNELQVLSISNDTIYLTKGGFVKLPTVTDTLFNNWDKSTGIAISESQITDLNHFTNADETDPVFNASLAKQIAATDTTYWGLDADATNELQVLSINNDTIYLTNGGFAKLPSETDPIFSAWDKSTDIVISESQITDLDHFNNADETDPVFNASLAKQITSADTTRWGMDDNATNELQVLSISNDTIYLSNGGFAKLPDETDPVYAIDSSFIKTGIRSWNNSLSKTIDAADTTWWGRAETDPYYSADSSFIKTGVREWDSSLAKNITSADTTYWNNKTYISDLDDDTKIETEHTSDEDIIRMKLAGTETMSMNDSSGIILNLPTSNDNSSMKVKNSNGNVVFGVDGRGLINGDGSGLSNIKPLIAYVGGNSDVIVTSYNPYNPTLIKYIEITVPGPGIILTQATGYIQWKSTNDDYCRMSIISNDVATNTADFGSNYFSYLMLSGDHNLTDSIDEYNNFGYSRVFTVSSSGTYRYNLWADKGYSRCNIQIADANIQAIYFPAGGTGDLTIKSASLPSVGNEDSVSEFDPSIPRNLDGSICSENILKTEYIHPPASKHTLEEKLKQQQEQIDSLKIIVDKLLIKAKFE